MSLILEALRKSEAERQRGRAPGLFVEQVATRPTSRATLPAWAWLVGALLLATLAVLAWPLLRGQGPNPVPDQAQVADLEPGPVAPAAASESALPAAPWTTAPEPPHTPAPVATTAPARAPDRASGPTGVAPSLENNPIAAPTPDPTPTIALPDRDQIPNPTPLPAPPAESLPTLANLDAATRSQLPPLKLSMHVFAEAPAQRFVILDGQRLGEGASPAAGIVLEEIRRDGLVLSVNGQRLLLARP